LILKHSKFKGIEELKGKATFESIAIGEMDGFFGKISSQP
jgi:hypothetical protein